MAAIMPSRFPSAMPDRSGSGTTFSMVTPPCSSAHQRPTVVSETTTVQNQAWRRVVKVTAAMGTM